MDSDTTEYRLVEMSDGAQIMIRRWNRGPGKRIVVSHGNGLAVDGFRLFGSALASEFEVVAYDLRNHGKSQGHRSASVGWLRYISDVPEIWHHIDAIFGALPTHGAFHSMSSVCTLLSQLSTPLPWQSLSLFEPPLPTAIDSGLFRDARDMHVRLAERTKSRRRFFNSRDELVKSFMRSSAFTGVSWVAAEQLADGSLIRNEDDADLPWRLACDPEIESRNYSEADALAPLWNDLGRIGVPVQIVLGDESVHDMPELLGLGRLMAKTYGFESVTIPNSNHFMQLQQPAACADVVVDFARRSEGVASARTDANTRL